MDKEFEEREKKKIRSLNTWMHINIYIDCHYRRSQPHRFGYTQHQNTIIKCIYIILKERRTKKKTYVAEQLTHWHHSLEMQLANASIHFFSSLSFCICVWVWVCSLFIVLLLLLLLFLFTHTNIGLLLSCSAYIKWNDF